MMSSSLEILEIARALIEKAIAEEKVFGEGEGANFIVFDNAERMVREYATACSDGTINEEPI